MMIINIFVNNNAIVINSFNVLLVYIYLIEKHKDVSVYISALSETTFDQSRFSII